MTTVEHRIAAQKSKKEYKKLIHLTNRDIAFGAIQKIIDHKHRGNECLCNCLGACLRLQNTMEEIDASYSIHFTRKYLPYLICSLKHESLTENEMGRKKIECGEIACHLAQIDKSTVLFDQAIECGNSDALYYKSLLLSELPSAKDTIAEQIDLLERNIRANSHLKDLALKRLGLKYYTKDNKKSFMYLNQITQKDNDVLDALTYFYIEGIKSDEGWFQEPDREKAQECLTLMMSNLNHKDLFYYHLLFLRGSIFYKQNKLYESFQDLSEVANNTENQEHKMSALWHMGIIEFLIQEDNEIIPQEAIFLLQSALNLLYSDNSEEAALDLMRN